MTSKHNPNKLIEVAIWLSGYGEQYWDKVMPTVEQTPWLEAADRYLDKHTAVSNKEQIEEVASRLAGLAFWKIHHAEYNYTESDLAKEIAAVLTTQTTQVESLQSWTGRCVGVLKDVVEGCDVPHAAQKLLDEIQNPPAVPICPMAAAVAERINARAAVGLKKYGTNLTRTDLTDLQWFQHLQDELMDAAVYVERLKHNQTLSTLPTTPNLVERVRELEKARDSVLELIQRWEAGEGVKMSNTAVGFIKEPLQQTLNAKGL